MIRNKYKIFGEKNDPNTVLAGGTLLDGALLVGAGNKAIKPFVPGADSLLLAGNGGEASAFSYRQPNKLLGTDDLGKLKLYDIPEFTKYKTFGTASNQISNIIPNPDNIFIQLVELGPNYAYFNKTTDDSPTSPMEFLFRSPLVFDEDKECFVTMMVSSDMWALRNLRLVSDSGTSVLLAAGSTMPHCISVNAKITIPAGSYSSVIVDKASSSKSFLRKSIAITGIILYKE